MNKDIAIIGMAGRFPDARDLDELHLNLMKGKDSVAEITPERINRTTLPPGRKYRAAGYLKDIDMFDNKFFNISLGEAQAMDPIQRLLLEVVYEAIENAGYNVDHFNGTRTAVFVGDASTDYYKHADVFMDTLITGNSPSFVATRITRHLNINGNAAMINTACSSSGTAIHFACNELLLGEAEYALVCGINLYLFPYYDNTNEMNIWSPDGKSKAFSAEANGMSNGEIAAAILLKPLEKALQDDDIIHAVIKSSAINNNANRSDSPYAPDSITQAEVIKMAWQKAGITPLDIGYIETHGSGTQLGDTLEIEGMKRAFKEYTDKKKICPISTIKSNTGHGMSGAGIAGLIKTVLSMKHRVIYPTIHFKTPNPMIDFENSPVYVNTLLKEWDIPAGKTRLAGVTTLGASGTNNHIILEEAPPRNPLEKKNKSNNAKNNYLVTVSSKTAEGLTRNLGALHEVLSKKERNQINIVDLSYTLNRGRKHYPHRYAVIAADPEALIMGIDAALGLPDLAAPGPRERKKIIFIFSPVETIPGNFLNSLSERYEIFRESLKRCTECCGDYNQQFYAFAFQYAFYKLLEAVGIVTGDVLGIGPGRIVTNVITGETTLAEGIEQALAHKPREITDLDRRVTSLLDREAGEEPVLFIELGLESIISRELRKRKEQGDNRVDVFSLEDAVDGSLQLLQLVKLVYLSDFSVDWEKFYTQHEKGHKIELPTYRFEKTRCWLREEPRMNEKELGKELFNDNEKYLDIKENNLPLLEEKATGVEQKIAGCWAETLGIRRFSREDNFFDLGGDSLKATKVINQLNEEFDISLDFEDIFDYPTVDSLAIYIYSLMDTVKRVGLTWKDVLKMDRVEVEDNFFNLGGHSLLANQVLLRIKMEFQLELNFEDLFNHPTLGEFSGYIDHLIARGGQHAEYETIEPIEKRDYYDVSSPQKRLWMLSQLEEGSAAYNTLFPYWLKGKPDFTVMDNVFKALILRHESLRTVFVTLDGEPKQRILPWKESGYCMEKIDLGNSHNPSQVYEIINNDAAAPFNLATGPLLRIKLIRLQEETYILLITAHHIICDGWSTQVFFPEMLKIYNAYNCGQENPFSPLRIQYKDYAAWQDKRLAGEFLLQQQQYWLKRFEKEVPVLNLPTDYERPGVQSFQGSREKFNLGKNQTVLLKEFARQQNVTLFMALLAAYNVLLYKLSGQQDIVVGTIIAGRRHVELEKIIGVFVNTLPLRNYPGGNKPFKDFLAEIRMSTLEALENQDYPFEQLVQKVEKKKDLRRNPIFDVLFEFQEFASTDESIPGLLMEPYEYEDKIAMFDINFSGREENEEIVFSVEYSVKLFKKETIQRLISYFKKILAAFMENPGIEIAHIELISNEEKSNLLKKIRTEKGKELAGAPVEKSNREKLSHIAVEFNY